MSEAESEKTGQTPGSDTSQGKMMSQGKETSPWKWRPTSAELLAEAESRIYKKVQTPYTAKFVDIDGATIFGRPESVQIWTISMNEGSQGTPIVLIHGLGAAAGFWCLNFDTLASNRPVYAIDNIGFGRSSRPVFSTDPAKAAQQFVSVLEEWRRMMNLEKFVLVGHSLGGYIVTSYTIAYPQRIAHLVLADPWGFTEKPSSRNVPFWVRAVSLATQQINPFAAIRIAGPLGQGIMEKAMHDLIKRFAELNEDGDVKFGQYLYHCNAQKPSGEVAFRTMMDNYRWAKLPLIRRISTLSPDINVTVIWGEKSFLHRIPAEEFQKLRPGSYTDVHVFEGVGHDVYSEGKEDFNNLVFKACLIADSK